MGTGEHVLKIFILLANWGANCSIAAEVIWFVAGLAVCAIGKKKVAEDENEDYDEAADQIDEEAVEKDAEEDDAAEEEGETGEK